jgi:crotonobetainyl-CoA:carnitine CoA-transferase CaiB-like acyl-CoA transferase
VKFSYQLRADSKIGIAPRLGERNNEVLGDLGYSTTQIVDLKNRKVI